MATKYDRITAKQGELIEASPQDVGLRQQRTALLQQVGLADIARDDMKRQVPHSP